MYARVNAWINVHLHTNKVAFLLNQLNIYFNSELLFYFIVEISFGIKLIYGNSASELLVQVWDFTTEKGQSRQRRN